MSNVIRCKQEPSLLAHLMAVLAALLFGASVPLAKLLLGRLDPLVLTALLYLGSGAGAALYKGWRGRGRWANGGEPGISREDLPWLTGSILAGGIAAPLVLMFSLVRTPAATASLLLNFEGLATALLAALMFKEAMDRRVWWAVALIMVASVLLSLGADGRGGVSAGALGVLGACVLWGLDNNFTRNVSAKDPVSIVAAKGLGAGAFSLFLAVVAGHPFPGPAVILGAVALGSISYGLSIVLLILAMRELGAARASSLFGTAPFMGAMLSFLLFREAPGALFVLALPLLTAGVILMAGEKHGHAHTHTAMEHEHRHRHDQRHHSHEHTQGEPYRDRPHTHRHQHETTQHVHHHLPDIHHRHGHSMGK